MQATLSYPTLGPCIFDGESTLSLVKPQDHDILELLEEDANMQKLSNTVVFLFLCYVIVFMYVCLFIH